MSLDSLPPLMRMVDVTTLLDVHHKTVRQMVAAKKLPAFRLGRELRFKREDVLALLKPVPTAS